MLLESVGVDAASARAARPAGLDAAAGIVGGGAGTMSGGPPQPKSGETTAMVTAVVTAATRDRELCRRCTDGVSCVGGPESRASTRRRVESDGAHGGGTPGPASNAPGPSLR